MISGAAGRIRTGGAKRVIRRLAVGGLIALLGATGTAEAKARRSQSLTPEQAPTAWIAYAQAASGVVRGLITGI